MKTIKIILLIVLITLLSACTDTKTSEKNNTKENVSSNKIEENNRITSYNVCYTKLLRSLFSRPLHTYYKLLTT